MTHVYVIQAEGGPVKVGIAANPVKRLAALQTASPFRLRLVHAEAVPEGADPTSVESAAHALLWASREAGEWFSVSSDVAQAAVAKAMQSAPEAFPPALSRGARGLLDWSQSLLADRSNLSESTIRDFEKGRRVPSPNNLAAIQRALEAAGVEFTNGGEPGVKLRKELPAT